mmetsp:Transcript_71601/g.158183  ORF Transcript_71601/g.158183 Transcript_71601/m.158183 type:complete len:233 (-) Transcript_71601:33-731(-)
MALWKRWRRSQLQMRQEVRIYQQPLHILSLEDLANGAHNQLQSSPAMYPLIVEGCLQFVGSGGYLQELCMCSWTEPIQAADCLQDDWKHNTRTICTSSIHCLTVKVLTQSQGGSLYCLHCYSSVEQEEERGEMLLHFSNLQLRIARTLCSQEIQSLHPWRKSARDLIQHRHPCLYRSTMIGFQLPLTPLHHEFQTPHGRMDVTFAMAGLMLKLLAAPVSGPLVASSAAQQRC